MTGQDAIDGLTEAHRCQGELIRYFEDMVRVRRVEPRVDLLSALIAAEEDGSQLDDDELIAMCVLLLFAGHETTTHLIGNGVLALIEWPNEFDRLLPFVLKEKIRNGKCLCGVTNAVAKHPQ